MFGGDDNQLSKVVELCKYLSATAERPYNQRTPKGCGGGAGYNHGSHGKGGGGACKEDNKEKDKKSGASTPFEGKGSQVSKGLDPPQMLSKTSSVLQLVTRFGSG